MPDYSKQDRELATNRWRELDHTFWIMLAEASLLTDHMYSSQACVKQLNNFHHRRPSPCVVWQAHDMMLMGKGHKLKENLKNLKA